MSECCKSGFKWDGKSEGKTGKIAGLDTYITGNGKAGILIIADVFGWELENTRIIADHFAKEVGATVYLPDFFHGEALDPDTMENEEKRKNFDIGAFIGRHSKDKRYPECEAVVKEMKQSHSKIGCVGYCWGAWACFQLGAKGKNLIDAVSVAHPSLCTKEEIDALAVPTQINSPEHDPQYTAELKEHSNKVIPTLNIPYDYQYYPGLTHGFAVRGNQSNKAQKDGLERCKNAVVHWFSEFLSN